MNISSVCIYLPWPSPGRDVSETGSKYTRCLGQTQVDSVAAIRQANWLSLPVAAETERKRRRKRKTGKERVVKTQLELKTVPWNVRATRPGSRKVRNPITLWFSSRKSWCNLIFLATHTPDLSLSLHYCQLLKLAIKTSVDISPSFHVVVDQPTVFLTPSHTPFPH